MKFDVVVLGGGAGGLAAINRIAQMAPSLSICLIEKNEEHIVYPAIFHEIFSLKKDGDTIKKQAHL